MNKFLELMKKYWIVILGFCIIFASFLYFFTVAYNEGWIPPIVIVIIGLVAGISLCSLGFYFYKKELRVLSEILAGFGCSIMYATIAYSGITALWSNTAVFVSLIALTVFTTWVSFTFNLRILTSLGFAGGLFTPLIVRASSMSMYLLFFYVFIINAAILFFCLMKKWRELPIIGMILTFMLYISYYLYFVPQYLIEPLFYVSAIYLLYAVGLLLISRKDGTNFEGLNLYLSIINGIWFTFWAIFIFNSFSLSSSIPILIVGIMFIISAAAIYFSFPTSKAASMIYFFGGLMLIVISGGDIGSYFPIRGMDHVLRGSIWLGISFILYLTGLRLKNKVLLSLGIGSWFFVFIYWFIFAWNIEWVKWFGVKYVPFINPPALLWIGLSAIGFFISYSFSARYEEFKYRDFIVMKYSPVVLSLTNQIITFWDAYDIKIVTFGIILSIVWGIYALLLFVWGMLSKSKFFIFFADAVLVFVSLKIVFYDITGVTSIYKAISIFATGLIILVIGYLNYIWQTKINTKKEKIENASSGS